MSARAAQPGAAFSANQLSQWKAYEKVRRSGQFNMFDPRAKRATGLSADAYSFVMENYSELKAAIAKAQS